MIELAARRKTDDRKLVPMEKIMADMGRMIEVLHYHQNRLRCLDRAITALVVALSIMTLCNALIVMRLMQ